MVGESRVGEADRIATPIGALDALVASWTIGREEDGIPTSGLERDEVSVLVCGSVQCLGGAPASAGLPRLSRRGKRRAAARSVAALI